MSWIWRNWWKLLPFTLVFFGFEGLAGLCFLLLIYAPLRKFSPKTPRGCLLTSLIVLEAVFLALTLIATILSLSQPTIWSFYNLAEVIFEAFCLVGVWFWRRWAAFAFIIVLTVGTVISLGAANWKIGPEVPLGFKLLAAALVAAWPVLWFLALRRNWSKFSTPAIQRGSAPQQPVRPTAL
jgi:hypothetical protein